MFWEWRRSTKQIISDFPDDCGCVNFLLFGEAEGIAKITSINYFMEQGFQLVIIWSLKIDMI